MDLLFYTFLPFVAVLGILIFFHELGHFLVAKYFDVKVLKFSIGFGYKLAGRKIGETEYVISTVPFGGYVKMLGENDDETEPIPPDEAKRAFHNQHVLKRIAIVAAGPFFNFVLAVVLFCGFFVMSGKDVRTTEIGQVREGSPADRAGLQKGDVIISIQGENVESWSHIKGLVHDKAGMPCVIIVKRGDDFLNMEVVPEEAVVKNIFGEEVKSALIGIVDSGKFEKLELDPFQAIKEGFLRTLEVTSLTCTVLVKLFKGAVSIKTIGGPILIGQMTGQVAQESFSLLIPFMALISINLAILNLLPVPILDGGAIIFFLIELLIGKPISIKKRDLAQKVGLFLLALLIVVVTINDLSRIEFIRRLLEKALG